MDKASLEVLGVRSAKAVLTIHSSVHSDTGLQHTLSFCKKGLVLRNHWPHMAACLPEHALHPRGPLSKRASSLTDSQ